MMGEKICYICGGKAVKNDCMTLRFELEGVLVIIHNVPGYECAECHEQIYSGEVARKIEQILNRAEQEVKAKAMLMGKMEYQYAA